MAWICIISYIFFYLRRQAYICFRPFSSYSSSIVVATHIFPTYMVSLRVDTLYHPFEYEGFSKLVSFSPPESGSYDSTYLTPATSPDLLSLLSDDIKCKVESHLVSGSRVTLGRMIGQGQYGRVHLGHLADEGNNCHIPVAVKKLKGEERIINIYAC